ncbi:MAG: LysE family translocator [Cytophagales bacterium]
MLAAIRDGIFLGLGLSVLIGPVFFTLIQTSMNRGFKSAVFLALGISLSDIFYVAITFIGLSSFTINENFKFYLGTIGGIILILFGLSMIFKKLDKNVENINVSSKERLKFFLKGFAINALNPSVVFFWIATMGIVTIEWGYEKWEILILFTMSILTVFFTDLFKSFLADKLSGLLTPKFIKTTSVIMGLLLIVFGTKMMYETGMSKKNFVEKTNQHLH